MTVPELPVTFTCGACPPSDNPEDREFWEFPNRVRQLLTEDGPVPVCPDCSRDINRLRLSNQKPVLWDGLL